MDETDDRPTINAAFARLAIDCGTGAIMVESRCNRCGLRIVGTPLTLGHDESTHLLQCFKEKRNALQVSSSGSE